MKEKVLYTLYAVLFIFALSFGIFLMYWTIHNTDAVSELEGQINQLTLGYQIKLQECVNLKEENENLKTYISTIERYMEIEEN